MHTITVDLGTDDVRTFRGTTTRAVRSIKAHRPRKAKIKHFPTRSCDELRKVASSTGKQLHGKPQEVEAVRRGTTSRYDGAVQLGRSATPELDEETASWLRRLVSSASAERQVAERELHDRLLRIARAEVRRRSASTPVTGPELDDVAHQAAADAMLAILAKLAEFRGESRFITWAYRFVILEVSSKLGRHYWRNPPVALDAAQWERLPDRLGLDPHQHAEAAGILAEVRHVVDTELTGHQRRIFIAIVVDGIPLNALAEKLDLQRNAIYKVIFDARRKIRRALIAKGYLDEMASEQR